MAYGKKSDRELIFHKALAERVAELEQREAGLGEDDFAALVDKFLAGLPTPEPGQPGADCDMAEVKALIDGQVAETVSAAFAALPVPKDGEPGEPGKDCDMEAVRGIVDEMAQQAVAEQLAEAVAALPPPEKGEKGEPGEPGEKGEPGMDGKDGIGLADCLLDNEGNLVLTMTDGRVKQLGRVVGSDGEPGKDGKTFTLDDFDIVPTDERTIELKFINGDIAHVFELEFPVIVYRDVWKAEGEAYKRGDAVTWAGSLWIAERDAPGKPDTADCGWKLAVKRGRDGKDAAK